MAPTSRFETVEGYTIEQLAEASASVLLDFRAFCSVLSIATKGPADSAGAGAGDGPTLVPFTKWWPEQEDFNSRRTGRDLVLKTRQIGFTTIELARDLQYACLHDGVQVLVVGHNGEEIERLFGTARRWADELADAGLMFRPQYSSKRELVWRETSSMVRVVEAGVTDAVAEQRGRSGTIHRLHCTEFAFWRAADATWTSLRKAVPAQGEIVIESTANGIGNRFHRDVMRALQGELHGWRLHFWPWHAHPEYRQVVARDFDPRPLDDWERMLRADGCDDEQMAWWRQQIVELGGGAFGLERALQESPITPESAFRARGGQYVSAAACDRLSAVTREPLEVVPLVWRGRPQGAETLLGELDDRLDESASGAARDDMSASLRGGGLDLGELWIYERPRPLRRYVAPADVADGGGCLSAAPVMDRESGEIVAVYANGAIEAGDFGFALALIAWIYSGALIAVERNNAGVATLDRLRTVARYPRLYRGRDGKLGWLTSPTTRGPMWSELRRMVEAGEVWTPDVRMAAEVRGLILGRDGRPVHGLGTTDDLWTAWAIGTQLAQRVGSRESDERPPQPAAPPPSRPLKSQAARVGGAPKSSRRLGV